MKNSPASRRPQAVYAGNSDIPVKAVVLVGFMGAGKSSVGRAVSEKLGWRFEDLDVWIEARAGCSIPEIFQRAGEEGLRDLEHAALSELLAQLDSGMPLIVALGGGTFVHVANERLFEAPGLATVYLDAPVDELWGRCQDGAERPLRRDQATFQQLHERRRPRYLAAKLRIETAGKDINAVAEEVIARLQLGPVITGDVT
jgi:shikimate kinase